MSWRQFLKTWIFSRPIAKSVDRLRISFVVVLISVRLHQCVTKAKIKFNVVNNSLHGLSAVFRLEKASVAFLPWLNSSVDEFLVSALCQGMS